MKNVFRLVALAAVLVVTGFPATGAAVNCTVSGGGTEACECLNGTRCAPNGAQTQCSLDSTSISVCDCWNGTWLCPA